MQLISCQHGKLVRVYTGAGDDDRAGDEDRAGDRADGSGTGNGCAGPRFDSMAGGPGFSPALSSGGSTTGLPALDRLLPAGALALGAVHEVLWDEARHHPRPLFVAALFARAASGEGSGFGVRGSEQSQRREGARSETTGGKPGSAIGPLRTRHSGLGTLIWADPRGDLYPPALASAGIPLDRLLLLRAAPADLVWALARCLGCRGVGATVAEVGRLTRVQARRLRLAAERGGGAGVLVRPLGPASAEHAAVTRWLVEPAPGSRTVQRWKIQLIHGHGGLLRHPVYLERSRDPADTRSGPADAAAIHRTFAHADGWPFGGQSAAAPRPPLRVRAVDPVADRPPAPQTPPPRIATA